jgi:hypothetical protein
MILPGLFHLFPPFVPTPLPSYANRAYTLQAEIGTYPNRQKMKTAVSFIKEKYFL